MVPLWVELKDLVHSLNLDGKVILTGNLDNPFMLMKDCSCFILPSLHEGQPVSLLEARLLKLPIIMSNFSSAASSLFDNGQLVIGNSVDDIYNGLIAFINNEVPNIANLNTPIIIILQSNNLKILLMNN